MWTTVETVLVGLICFFIGAALSYGLTKTTWVVLWALFRAHAKLDKEYQNTKEKHEEV